MRDNAPWAHSRLADRLSVPTLLFAGPMCSPGVGALNPHVEVRSVAGAGHSLHRDRPELVLESI